MSEVIPYGVWWLEQTLAEEATVVCPPLCGPTGTDVCVVGGGFLGLWTAIEIREQAPDVDVVLIDREFCGAGASGRNGGWVTGWFDELDALATAFGDEAAVRLADRSHWAIDRIETFVATHGIECGFRRHGALWAASTAAQDGRWHDAVATSRRLDRADRLQLVDGAELRRRTGSPVPLAGARHTDAAAVQPAALVRGLRRVALELGVRIYEATPMLEVCRRGRPRVTTPAGEIASDQVVLALGAWSATVKELRRTIIPVASHIVLTEPLGARVAPLPWSRGELFGDARMLVHYAQVTEDGRIVFGRGGGRLGIRGRVSHHHFHDPGALASVAADFRRWFPDLADAQLVRGWGGPVDRTPNHFPFTGRLGKGGAIAYGAGFSGNGVGPSALFGRILGRQALGLEDCDQQLAVTRGPLALLPPEPLRAVGGTLVQSAVKHLEHRDETRTDRGPRPRQILRRLAAAHAPTALDARLTRLRHDTHGPAATVTADTDRHHHQPEG